MLHTSTPCRSGFCVSALVCDVKQYSRKFVTTTIATTAVYAKTIVIVMILIIVTMIAKTLPEFLFQIFVVKKEKSVCSKILWLC